MKKLTRLLMGGFLVGACASVELQSSQADGSCIGVGCQPTDAGVDQYTADVAVPDAPGDAPPAAINPLCGTGCVPDDSQACADEPSPPPPDAGDASTDAAEDADGSDAETPEGGGVSDTGPSPVLGCFVVATANGVPESACGPVGLGTTTAPCVSSSDCAAGFACIGEASAAQCRPFCCHGSSGCESGTYCAERRLADSPAGVDQKVPVCTQADNCDLADPYPCPPNKQCTCKEGTACTVVLQDGTTSCTPPGEGRTGDACPCAPGHVCAQAANSCLKICNTQAMAPECGTGKCQSVPYLPTGYGVCVLTSP